MLKLHRCALQTTLSCQKRFLNVHEYQAKILMDRYHVPHQRGFVVNDASSVKDVAVKVQKEFSSPNIIVKSQILAGGRGKGHFDTGYKGGVKFCTSADKAVEVSKEMLGNRLITVQTPKDGIKVQKVFVAECLDFERELYLAIVLDRATDGVAFIASQQGGMDIEHVAKETPEAIIKVAVKNIDQGPTEEQLNSLASFLGFESQSSKHQKAKTLLNNLYQLFCKSDATLLEVNPLVETKTGDVVCIDAKINFDDNSAFRQQEIFSWRDYDEEDPREVAASKFELNYVGLEGNVGCLVNGAGLALATMDIIKLYGGQPANFLDVGGGAKTEQVKEAFKILTSDPNVKAILVNIFGGIMKCDTIANGIVQAAKEINLQLPLVVRLSGTNADLGKSILEKSGINCLTADDLDAAAKKAVRVLQNTP